MITRRQAFLGLVSPAALRTSNRTPPAPFIDPKAVAMLRPQGPVNDFLSTFPQGCPATHANVQRLLNLPSWDVSILQLLHLPVSGKFVTRRGEFWLRDGKIHRDNDQPAVTFNDGERQWWQNDKLHRDNDQPARIFANGEQHWFQHGSRHRTNGPAVLYPDGREEQWVEGKPSYTSEFGLFYTSGYGPLQEV